MRFWPRDGAFLCDFPMRVRPLEKTTSMIEREAFGGQELLLGF